MNYQYVIWNWIAVFFKLMIRLYFENIKDIQNDKILNSIFFKWIMYVKIKDNDSVWITTKSVQKKQLFNMHAGVIIEGLNDIDG